MNATRILVVAIAACLAASAVLLIRDRSEAVIERTFLDLAREAGKNGDEGFLTSAQRIATIMESFSSNAVLQAGPPYPIRVTREELPLLLQRARTVADTIHVEVRGTEIEVAPDRRSAEMRTTVELSGTIDGRKERGMSEYAVAWERTGRKTWKIVRLEPRTTIHHPAAAGQP